MNSSDIYGNPSLRISIKNANAMHRLFKEAPLNFINTINHWLYSERKIFIGNKSHDGTVRRQLKKLKHPGSGPFKRPGGWAKNVINAFFGRIGGVHPNATMTMGIGSKKINKPFFRGLEKMEGSYSGDRSIKSSKYMPLPVSKNIEKYLGGRAGGEYMQAIRKFHDYADAGKLIPIKRGNNLLWFLNNFNRYSGTETRYSQGSKKGQFKKDALVFIGRKSVTLNPRFEFQSLWETRKPAAIKHAYRLIRETLRGLDKGYVKKMSEV